MANNAAKSSTADPMVPAGWIVATEGQVHIEAASGIRAPAPGEAVEVGDILVTGIGGLVTMRLVDGGAVALGSNGRLVVGDAIATGSGILWPSVVVVDGDVALTGSPDPSTGSPLLLAMLPEATVEIVGGPVVRSPGTIRLGEPLADGPTEVFVVTGEMRVSLLEPGSAVVVGRGLAMPLGPDETAAATSAARLVDGLQAAYGDLPAAVEAALTTGKLADVAPAAGVVGLTEALGQIVPGRGDLQATPPPSEAAPDVPLRAGPDIGSQLDLKGPFEAAGSGYSLVDDGVGAVLPLPPDAG